MNKSSLLLVIVALVVAMGGALLWMGTGEGAMPAPPSDDYFAQQEADAVAANVVETAAAAGGYEPGVDEGAEEERSEVEIQVDDAPRLVIQVWDRKRGKVAPEAKVFVLEGYGDLPDRDAFSPHWCEVAIDKGKRYTATTEGRVILPRLQRSAIVAATLNGASGMTRLRKEHRETESVLLLPDETVTVRVIDARGRALADVPVGIQQRIADRIDTDRVYKRWKEVSAELAGAKKQIAAATSPDERAQAERRLRGLEWRRNQMRTEMRDVKRALAAQEKASAKSKGKLAPPPPPPKPVAKGKKSAKPKTRGPARKSPQYVMTHSSELRARRRTDENGYAVFRHFQFYRQNAEKWWPKKDANRFDAVLMVPLAEPVRAPFRGKPVPEDVIELRMPPTGSVALRTVDRDGRPYTHPVRGELRIVDAKNPRWTRLQLRKEQNEREIVFPYVGLGMQLEASCRLDDEDFRWQAPPFAGPQSPGERLTVDLVVAPDVPMLYGRLLDVAGSPLANAKTTFLINSIRGRLEGEEVELDDDGRFHLPYEVRGQHQAPWRLQVRHDDRLPVPGLATTLGFLPTQGIMDIGDLQIGELSRITFGRVVNDLGEPIAGARVQLQREREVGSRGRVSWQDEAFTDTETDEGGNFALFGDLESGRYRLRVTAREHFPYEEPTLPSREGAVIRLDRRSRVVGSVILPEWLSSRRVKVRLESANDTSKGRDDRIHDWRGKKLIYFDWVRPGIYNVSLRIEDFPDPFLRVNGFEIVAGQRDTHPRLKDLDASRDLFRFEVFAVDEEGKRMNPKSPLRARVMRPDGSYAMVGFYWKGGRTEIINAQSSLEVLPTEQGFRSRPTTLVAGRNEVRFERVPAVTLKAPGMRQLVGEETVWISAEMLQPLQVASFDSRSRRMSQTMRRFSSSHGRLNARDRAYLRPLRDGRYRIMARMGDKRRGGLVAIKLGEVDVRLVPGGQGNVFTVPVDQRAVLDALQDVATRRAAADQRAASRPPKTGRGR